MLKITNDISVDDAEIEISAIRSMGAGGQNVNKVSSAIHLRFDVDQSSLPEKYKVRLLSLNDSRLTKDGVIVIKAQTKRTQEQNKEEALSRLKDLILTVMKEKKVRKATKPSLAAKRKRLDSKKRVGLNKQLRKNIKFDGQ